MKETVTVQVGDKVEKISGYLFPGVIVAKFRKLDNRQERFVVECTESSVRGMLHIFRENQLRCESTKQTY